MIRSVLLLALAALPLGGQKQSAISAASDSNNCPNSIRHELLVAYEVHGGTLTGPVDLNLLVYSDGVARLVDASDSDAPTVEIVQTDPDAVGELVRDLERYGGLLNCDEQGFVTDVPLHTLTLLRAGSDERAHSYSWWLRDCSNGATEVRIAEFIADAFPGR
jgi:hypothetical protein